MAMKILLSASALFTGAYAPYPKELPAHRMEGLGTSFLETESKLGVAATAQRLSASVSQLEAALRNHHAVQVKQAKALKKHRETARSYAKTAMKMLEAAQAQMRSVSDTEAELRLTKNARKQAKKSKSVFAHAASAPSGAIELKGHPTPKAASAASPEERNDDNPLDVINQARESVTALQKDEPWHNDEEYAIQDAPDTTAMLQTCKVDSTHTGSVAFEKLKECTQALKVMAKKAQEAHESSTQSNVDYAKKFSAVNALMTELDDVERLRTNFATDQERVGQQLLNKTEILSQPINQILSAVKTA